MADFLLCGRIADCLPKFESDVARGCAYGYFIFTGLSVIIYVMEMTDVCLTLKHDSENVFFARLAKSLVVACEEVPLPGLLYILYTTEPRLSLASPVFIASWIKLIALSWGIVKFTKLRFFWFCLPLNPKHTTRENIHRCFTFTLYRVIMLIVNICHFLAIGIVILNIIEAGQNRRSVSKT
uniref:TLC domain-containing protein n=1 Tax=Syphacia muris TaxID=451379 RepID=A0A0N5AHY2_9BILA